MSRKNADESTETSRGGFAGEAVRTIDRIASTKSVRKAEKAADKAEKKTVKRIRKDTKKAATTKDANIAIEKTSRFTPHRARNAVGVAKVLAPVVIPILAPLAVRVAGTAREAYDRYQARKLGITVDQLPQFTGHGAGLLARIAGASQGLADLKNSSRVSAADQEFTAQSQGTLEQLAASVRAAERMPTARRKATHRAVNIELGRLETQLLNHLGVSPAAHRD